MTVDTLLNCDLSKWKWDLRLCGGKTLQQFSKKVFFLIFSSNTMFHCVPSLPVQSSLFITVYGHWMRVSIPPFFNSSSTSPIPSSPQSSSFIVPSNLAVTISLALFHYSSFQHFHAIFTQLRPFLQRATLLQKNKWKYEKKKSKATGINYWYTQL